MRRRTTVAALNALTGLLVAALTTISTTPAHAEIYDCTAVTDWDALSSCFNPTEAEATITLAADIPDAAGNRLESA